LASVWAGKWPFFGVDSQVVVEVVPLSEVHGAAREVALQDLEVALGLGVLELEDAERPGRGHVVLRLPLVDLYPAQVTT